jgi:uncharacterized phage protein (TIGR01671 family)
MREIKFRGRGIGGSYKGVWCYGDMSHGSLGHNGMCTIWLEEKHYLSGIEVSRETIGQYTGLKDKDGREVYEGDLFSLNGIAIKVVYEPDGGRFCLRMADDENWMLSLDKAFCSQYQVVGNVHDNPELLNAE